jgi:hypothetical protein
MQCVLDEIYFVTVKTKPASVSTVKAVLVDVRPKAAYAPWHNARALAI